MTTVKFAVVAAAVGALVAAGGADALYLRPAPGDDIPASRLLGAVASSEPQQRSLAAVGLDARTGLWTYVARYATNASAWSATSNYTTECAAWVTGGNSSSGIQGSGPAPSTYSLLNNGGKYFNATDIYSSPLLHECTLVGLAPATRYSYAVGGSPREMSFVTPPGAPLGGAEGAEGAFRFAVMGDVGQTNYSNATMQGALDWARETGASTLLFPGDLSYADGEGVRWDSFGVLAEPLLGSLETIFAAGNHELSSGEAFVPFKARYANPNQTELWGSTTRGPVAFITLCGYCDFTAGSPQLTWLERVLAAVNRTSTPWVVAHVHQPMYNSNTAHSTDGELLRRAVEPLLARYAVDLVFAGHVHAYERTSPVKNFQPTACMPTYITVGDGGNREEVANTWFAQPQWSVVRESSFGFGTFEVTDAHTAVWTWRRNTDGLFEFPGQNPFPVEPSYAVVDQYVLDRTGCR
jgi:3',5'-cyclic AMP phosphodiesterase CpdA